MIKCYNLFHYFPVHRQKKKKTYLLIEFRRAFWLTILVTTSVLKYKHFSIVTSQTFLTLTINNKKNKKRSIM